MFIGQTVQYTEQLPVTDPRDPTPPPLVDWPAIIYKIINFDTRAQKYVVGLFIFTDAGIKHLRSVNYSQERKDGTWR